MPTEPLQLAAQEKRIVVHRLIIADGLIVATHSFRMTVLTAHIERLENELATVRAERDLLRDRADAGAIATAQVEALVMLLDEVRRPWWRSRWCVFGGQRLRRLAARAAKYSSGQSPISETGDPHLLQMPLLPNHRFIVPLRRYVLLSL